MQYNFVIGLSPLNHALFYLPGFVTKLWVFDSEKATLGARHLKNMLKINLNDLRIELVADWKYLSRFSRRWDEIVQKTPGTGITQTQAWGESWWKHFGENHRLNILIAIQGGQIVGVAPLMISEEKRHGRSKKILRWIGSREPESAGASPFKTFPFAFLAEKNSKTVLLAFLDWIHAHSEDWEMMELPIFPSKSPQFSMVQKYFTASDYSVWHQSENTCHKLSLLEDAKLKRLLTHADIQGPLDFFKKKGELLFWHAKTKADLDNSLGHFFDHHLATELLKKKISAFADERWKGFVTDLAYRTLENGMLRLSVASLDQNPLAFQLGFLLKKELLWGETSLNPEFVKQHPDRMLLHFVLDYAQKKKFTSVDLSEAAGFFKTKTPLVCESAVVFSSKLDYLWYRSRAK